MGQWLLIFVLLFPSSDGSHSVPWSGGSVGESIVPYTEKLWVQFLVLAHT